MNKFSRSIYLIALSLLLGVTAIQPLQARSNKQVLSRSTHKALTKIEAYNEQQHYQQAVDALISLQQKLKNKAYDQAITQQYLAYAYWNLGNNSKAEHYARKALDSQRLPKQAAQSLRYYLGQMLFHNYQFEASIALFKQYQDHAKQPNSEVDYLLAMGCYYLSDLEKAQQYLNQAFQLEKEIPVNWYQLQLNIYLESKNYAVAETVIQKLLSQSPQKVEWWKLLTQLYLAQDKYNKALASLSLAYQSKEIPNEDLQQLLYLFNHNELPAKAARLLNQAIQTQQLSDSYRNFKLLSQLWEMAKEKQKAIQALKTAIEKNPNSSDYLQLGLLYLQTDNRQQAIQALQMVTRIELEYKEQQQQLDYYLGLLHR